MAHVQYTPRCRSDAGPGGRCEQVVWVDLLTRAEFEAGFGSHTPMFTGQTKCVRYHMNFDRALAALKEVLLEEGHAYDANNRAGERGPARPRWHHP